MQIHFYKYHGAGNDFIVIDNRAGEVLLDTQSILGLCHRRFGIGADGLMLLERSNEFDFDMKYFNADGNESTMCGNGGRCIVKFAARLGLIGKQANFTAIDGLHHAEIRNDGKVDLQMNNVSAIDFRGNVQILNTGSPHYVSWVNDVLGTDVVAKGRDVRYASEFSPKGINVNFVQKLSEKSLFVRTYERGVEDETLSCGTGVTAAAIAASCRETGNFSMDITTSGGALTVKFTKNSPVTAVNVHLIGPAVEVYSGTIIS